ncbi:hypothetical protein [Micromonospora echinospora]
MLYWLIRPEDLAARRFRLGHLHLAMLLGPCP